MKRPIVGVMGSGSSSHLERCEPLGRWLATCGCHLLTGGGGGVMTAVSRAFSETAGRQGLVLGILPSNAEEKGRPPAGYPNSWVEVAIQTHLPLSGAEGTSEASRNHINVLTSDVLVFLPGSTGTYSELVLAVRHQRPTVLWAEETDEAEPDLPEGAETAAITIAHSLGEVQRFVHFHLPAALGD